MDLGILIIFAIVAVSFIVLIFIRDGIRVIPDYERLVIFRNGKCTGSLGPGLVAVIPLLERAVHVDIRERFHEISHETCVTKDNLTIDLDLLFCWKVVNPVWSQTRVQNLEASLEGLATGLLRPVIGRFLLDEVLAQLEKIKEELKDELEKVSEHLGVTVTAVEIRKILLPQDVREAINLARASVIRRQAHITEAEAEREVVVLRAEAEALARKRSREIEKEDGEKSKYGSVTSPPIQGNDVFVVHGHDEAAKESVSRFVEKLGLHPIILHEQPNAGRTIIEKFEDYSHVGFAIVLLTPDDISAPRENASDLKPRARQNVILELGYFIGKLGRGRVCALYKEGVEIPSDYQGVLYLPLDPSGAWRISLAKELTQAGMEADLKSAFGL